MAWPRRPASGESGQQNPQDQAIGESSNIDLINGAKHNRPCIMMNNIRVAGESSHPIKNPKEHIYIKYKDIELPWQPIMPQAAHLPHHPRLRAVGGSNIGRESMSWQFGQREKEFRMLRTNPPLCGRWVAAVHTNILLSLPPPLTSHTGGIQVSQVEGPLPRATWVHWSVGTSRAHRSVNPARRAAPSISDCSAHRRMG